MSRQEFCDDACFDRIWINKTSIPDIQSVLYVYTVVQIDVVGSSKNDMQFYT